MTQNYPEKNFCHLIEEGIEFGFNGWGFFGMEDSKVKEIFDAFVSSGIYHFDYRHSTSQRQMKRRNATLKIRHYNIKGFVLNMKSSIQTIFVLYFALIGISTAILGSEFVLCVSHTSQIFNRRVCRLR